MKKIFAFFVCAVIMIVGAFGISACGGDDSKDAVKLVPIEANSVGLMSDIDYYVVPEPAASAKVKALESLNFVGDLQALYGGENGYPQAVVVAKNDLTGSEILQKFIKSLEDSADWLLSDETSVEQIVDAIASHLTAGLEPSIKTQNLTKSVIKNCGIKFVSASNSKSEIFEFMEKFNSVSQTSFGIPADDFFTHTTSSFNSRKISVYAPDGAPALGLAKLMSENKIDGVDYEIVNANTIQTYVSGAAPKADICVLPVNLAVKLLGDGTKYKLLGTLTHGNLYMLSDSQTQITVSNLSLLKGKRVGVVNLAAVPGLTFKLILKNNGIDYIEN